MDTFHSRSSAIAFAIWLGLLVGVLGASLTARNGLTLQDALAVVLMSSLAMMMLFLMFNRTRLRKSAAIVRAADRSGRRP